jgi:hypothetical protein
MSSLQINSRTAFTLALIVGSSAVFAGVYLANVRGDPVAAPAASPAPAAAEVPSATPASVAQPTPQPAAAPAVTVELLAQWIADSASADAAKRATAIAALANAPRTDALPVLRRLLTDGEPQVDRPLALRSLRDLALSQGDADGAIRDAIRHAIYHGDDQIRTDDAQDVLDVIEESLQK